VENADLRYQLSPGLIPRKRFTPGADELRAAPFEVEQDELSAARGSSAKRSDFPGRRVYLVSDFILEEQAASTAGRTMLVLEH
jgi:hypothetical protein